MNFSKKNHKLVRQNEKSVRKSQKHEVNLQKNSTIYFQVGLILCLLASYFFMDMKFLSNNDPYVLTPESKEIAKVFTFDKYKLYEDKTKKVIHKKEKDQVVIRDKFKEIPNDVSLMEPKLEIVTPQQNTSDVPMDPNDIVVVEPPTNDIVIFELIEEVPIFPGCEGLSTNDERKSCMSEKISRLVQRKFNTNVGDGLGLSGEQHFHVQFKIDQFGYVSNIETNAKYKALDKEAKRVIRKIPKMKPGKQQDKTVSVLYNLPIVFHVFN